MPLVSLKTVTALPLTLDCILQMQSLLLSSLISLLIKLSYLHVLCFLGLDLLFLYTLFLLLFILPFDYSPLRNVGQSCTVHKIHLSCLFLPSVS